MHNRRKRRWIPLVVTLLVVGVIGYALFQTINHPGKVMQLVTGKKSLIAEVNGRTNVLLLGIGGGNHDGPNLTDTIMLASLDRATNDVTLVSIPRDLWTVDSNGNGGKINRMYAVGQEVDNPKDGLFLASQTVTQVTGQPIQYAFRLDFDGFTKVINLLGGIDVQVERTLDDYAYPIEGKEDDTCGYTPDQLKEFAAQIASGSADDTAIFSCRYMHLHVDKGLQHMDGDLALRFVRSRHAAGPEGTDFARSHRQQLVIEAVRNKIFSIGTLTDINKLMGLYNIVQSSIDTNIPQNTIPEWVDILRGMQKTAIHTAVIDFGDSDTGRYGLLDLAPIEAQYNYGSVLIPRLGGTDYSEIHAFVTCELATGNCPIGPTPFASPEPTATPSGTLKQAK